MSKDVVTARKKNLKKEKIAKKAKQKKIITILVCAVLVLAVAGFVFIMQNKQKTTETYGLYGQTVQLLPDGKFTAALAHNVNKSGTYTKKKDGNNIIVSFNINGKIESGRITDNNLYLPEEWDDGHGHGSVFPKINDSPDGDHDGHDH